jgi:hypothetical protein
MKPGAPWPGLEERFVGRGKAKLTWSPVEAEVPPGARPFDTGTLDLRALLATSGAEADNAAAYLYRTLACDTDQTVRVFCGSDDGLRLWLDGELCVDRPVPRGLNVFDEELTLALTPGMHHLLVKVCNLSGAWAFEMRERRASSQDGVQRAIERGVQRLLEWQLIDGSWGERRDEYPNGQTGLAVYTLLKCGVSPRHAAVQQALACMRADPSEKLYARACQLLALTALHDPVQLPWITELSAWILARQESNGGWSYPSEHTDLSNTHLAAFSLRAAAQAGVAVPTKAWSDVASFALRHQEARRKAEAGAGFTYQPGNDQGYTGSMTCAGVAVLALARETLGERMASALRLQVEPAIEAGLAWLARHWSVRANPNKPDWHLYYLYALERVGSLLGRETLGGHDWYAEGASVLVSRQESEGGWGAQCDTCFALLFLRRATSLPVSAQTAAEGKLFATKEGEGALRLRVKLGAPSILWVDVPENAAHEYAAVEFSVRPPRGEWRDVPPSQGELAARFTFDLPGVWGVRAAARREDGSELNSSTLEVVNEEGLDPERLPYADDFRRNRLGGAKLEVTSSSALEPAANGLDNKIWTRWLCVETDADPWIELDPERPLEITRLLLTPARTARVEAARHARPATVELWINREPKPRVLAIDADPQRKTVVEFSPPLTLQRLKLRITALEGGTLGKAAVGFAEIEAQSASKSR